MEKVVGCAAVAEADIEHTIRAEGDLAAIVVAGGLLNVEQGSLAVRVGALWIVGDTEFGDAREQVAVVVIDIEQAIALVLRVEGRAEQTGFVGAVVDALTDIEKNIGSGDVVAVGEDADYAALLGDKDAVAAVTGVVEEDRAIEREVWEGPVQSDGL